MINNDLSTAQHKLTTLSLILRNMKRGIFLYCSFHDFVLQSYLVITRQYMSLPPTSRSSGLTVLSLADLLNAVGADMQLSARQRQDTCSALRIVGRALGRPLAELPARPRQLRERLAALTPAMVGVSKGRWANI